MVSSKISNLTILRGEGDWWWAGSLQQGVDWLKCNGVADRDIVLFVNDDVTFENDFLEIALQLLDQQAGMLLPQVLNQKTGKIEESGVHVDFIKFKFVTAETPEKINCLPTRGLFMRMSELRRVGDFHPRMLPHYLSDYEFTIRANRVGVRLSTSSKLLIQSDGDATGYKSFEGLSFFEFMKRYFSIKSAFNPLYSTVFVMLASPRLCVPLNLIKIWLGVGKSIIGQVIPASFTGKNKND
jgi:GT2 family glycosyltransferase